MNDDSLERYTEANRGAWNEVMPLHQRAASALLDAAFLRPGHVALPDDSLQALQRIGLEGEDVAHLCCNNGVELLSIKNLGAARCVGFDISDVAIGEAQRRARLADINCEFVRSDVYAIPDDYDGAFDRVYISAGALGWMPDLARFFSRVAALLRTRGQVLIHEIHPVSEMLPFDDQTKADPLRIIVPYIQGRALCRVWRAGL